MLTPVHSPEEIDRPLISFKPEFLHHFIEDEIIRGYEEPKLDFFFAPLTMDCYFSYSFKSRTKESVNLEIYFETFFLNGLITERAVFEERLKSQRTFVIPAKRIGQVERLDAVIDTYFVEDITEPAINHYLKHFQIFLKFFIETGSYVDDSDSMWKHILMVERVESCDPARRQADLRGLRLLLPFLQRTRQVQSENQPAGDPTLLPEKRARLRAAQRRPP